MSAGRLPLAIDNTTVFPSFDKRTPEYVRPSRTSVESCFTGRSYRSTARSHFVRDADVRYRCWPSLVHAAKFTRGDVAEESSAAATWSRADVATSTSQSPSRFDTSTASPVGLK